MAEPMSKGRFLVLATVFEGGLLVLAFLLGWWLDRNPLAGLRWQGRALSLGLLGTLPLLVFFGVSYRLEIPQMERIKRMLLESLGPLLARCRWYELAYVAALAGICEEALFRGLLQPWFESLWGPWPALLLSNVLFGLAHSVTLLYTVLAMLTGIYLGWLLQVSDGNLLVPVLVHSLYDFAAFLVVVLGYRQQRAAAD